MFSVFHILTTYVDTSGVNCNTNSHLSAIQALGVSGSIGTKCIKIYSELHFLFTSNNIYKASPEQYKKRLKKNVTKTYKK